MAENSVRTLVEAGVDAVARIVIAGRIPEPLVRAIVAQAEREGNGDTARLAELDRYVRGVRIRFTGTVPASSFNQVRWLEGMRSSAQGTHSYFCDSTHTVQSLVVESASKQDGIHLRTNDFDFEVTGAPSYFGTAPLSNTRALVEHAVAFLVDDLRNLPEVELMLQIDFEDRGTLNLTTDSEHGFEALGIKRELLAI